ncbi:hypothetical protein HWB92_gp035 [Serratia phage vB_SmaA_3M]|uniref:Uncharacterized protein n=1 Tax=Serratia phage vB_SmaA_3M TaxID=2419930 RepID=A0A3G2YS14_9CAUD|nr:hypothetical protein HWB92_gp035 [Serratia phage vB_SmaA_3M]AYP28293.1 hypothetical protein 3M_037c [Serratia phage vB_SmaA_3M]
MTDSELASLKSLEGLEQELERCESDKDYNPFDIEE